jgi:hypothetical protein
MPIIRLLDGAAFDAPAAKAITAAFDDALREMHLDRTDPIAKIVARNVIRYAQQGERDPARLKERATEFLRE